MTISHLRDSQTMTDRLLSLWELCLMWGLTCTIHTKLDVRSRRSESQMFDPGGHLRKCSSTRDQYHHHLCEWWNLLVRASNGRITWGLAGLAHTVTENYEMCTIEMLATARNLQSSDFSCSSKSGGTGRRGHWGHVPPQTFMSYSGRWIIQVVRSMKRSHKWPS